jgi:hypothetical protein
MSTNIISLDDARLLLHKLKSESIPVVAFFAAVDGSTVVLPGFVSGITSEDGLVISSVRELPLPLSASILTVKLPGDPQGSECSFMYGDKREVEDERRREELAGKYGDSGLAILLPSGARLNLLFTP